MTSAMREVIGWVPDRERCGSGGGRSGTGTVAMRQSVGTTALRSRLPLGP
jgi:hypothetical protein